MNVFSSGKLLGEGSIHLCENASASPQLIWIHVCVHIHAVKLCGFFCMQM